MPDPARISNPIHISTPIKWTICAMAALGFLFDIYEVLGRPPGVAARRHGTRRIRSRHARVPPLDRTAVLDPASGRRILRAMGRLPGGSLRPPAHPGVEHPALHGVGPIGGNVDAHGDAAPVSRAVLRRRVRRIHRGRRVARRAVPRSENTRSRARLHAVVLFAWRCSGRRRILSRESLSAPISPRFTADIRRGATH